jgi:leader peptidase (prepilin peptidase) / N-methyltransferase
MTAASTIAAGIIGAIVGSFLNVCIYRLPLGRSIVWPASACTNCARHLAWFENIPILSYLVLRGRCRTCRHPISAQYPIVEALTALMFAGGWALYGPSVLLVSHLVFGCALIVLFMIDFEHFILPNEITLPGIVVGFLFSLLSGEPGWLSSLIGIAAGGGFLWLTIEVWFRIRKVEGMGFGDVKMMAMIGAFLGWQLTFVTLVMASVAGSILGVALIASGRGELSTKLPFGTFLALGAALTAVVGRQLLNWYLGFW